ncbi:hypothetical protein RND71_018256 [Anisodus tanguticus]|uniref:ABC transporter domain-containing protein n=1 Tax=Anisodus tanguticus TaxID=243964 RepID=A0AAE1S3W3_9SOLA|nr:hypothetical protein RND71_018256 [Anisodus tanguticus]
MEAESSPPPSPPPSQSPPLKTYKLTASSIGYSKSTTISPALLFKPCKTTTPINILKDISFTAYPSQILAIVGPSGAGKSTLLDILATGTSPTSGTLLLNSLPLHNPSSFRKLSAYVPQHDCCLPQLTVSETFAFSARLLNPNLAGVSCIVDSLLAELRLTHLAHTRLAHGLSGGERRRVSIGLSLLHDPAILLLDEPTSGLDSNSALNVMQTLRSITDSRQRTVLLSIHQPSFKILATIDKILLLSKGTVVHYGTLSSLEGLLLENNFTVPPQLNSLEYAMEMLNRLNYKNPIISCLELPPSPENPTTSIPETKTVEVKYRSSRVHEIAVLYSRFWKIIYRTKELLLTNTLQALGVGIVLGTIYINIGLGKAGIEKRFGLCASWQAFTYFVLTIWVILLMANSFVLFLSSIAPNYIAGTSLVTLLLAGSFLFSGYFISKETMPKFWTVLHYLSMYKYGLDAFLINEYSCLVTKCLIWYDEKNSVCMLSHLGLEPETSPVK